MCSIMKLSYDSISIFFFKSVVLRKTKTKRQNLYTSRKENQVQRSIAATDDINGSRRFGHHRTKEVKDRQRSSTKSPIDGSFLEISITIVCHHGIYLYVNHKASYQGHLRFAVSSLSTTNP